MPGFRRLSDMPSACQACDRPPRLTEFSSSAGVPFSPGQNLITNNCDPEVVGTKNEMTEEKFQVTKLFGVKVKAIRDFVIQRCLGCLRCCLRRQLVSRLALAFRLPSVRHAVVKARPLKDYANAGKSLWLAIHQGPGTRAYNVFS